MINKNFVPTDFYLSALLLDRADDECMLALNKTPMDMLVSHAEYEFLKHLCCAEFEEATKLPDPHRMRFFEKIQIGIN